MTQWSGRDGLLDHPPERPVGRISDEEMHQLERHLDAERPRRTSEICPRVRVLRRREHIQRTGTHHRMAVGRALRQTQPSKNRPQTGKDVFTVPEPGRWPEQQRIRDC